MFTRSTYTRFQCYNLIIVYKRVILRLSPGSGNVEPIVTLLNAFNHHLLSCNTYISPPLHSPLLRSPLLHSPLLHSPLLHSPLLLYTLSSLTLSSLSYILLSYFTLSPRSHSPRSHSLSSVSQNLLLSSLDLRRYDATGCAPPGVGRPRRW